MIAIQVVLIVLETITAVDLHGQQVLLALYGCLVESVVDTVIQVSLDLKNKTYIIMMMLNLDAALLAAVTIALWLYRGFPARKVPSYIAAQVLGATLATLLVYSNYRYSIGIFEGSGIPSSIRSVTGPHATAPMFFTFPQPWLPASSAFLSEAIASAVLISVIFALGDKGNLPPPKGTMAFAMVSLIKEI